MFRNIHIFDRVLIVIAALVLTASFVRIHLRVQTTVIGYRIGALKESEKKLLESRSNLQMRLAKTTTKEHLNKIIESQKRYSKK